MPLNIPMPDLPGNALLKGIDTGGTLFSRLMQPRLAREQQDLEREKQKQLHQHFLQKLIADKEGAERSEAFQSRFDPLKMSILQQKLLGLKQRNDPNYELNKFMNAAKAFGGGQGGIDVEQLKQNPLLRGFFKHQLGFDPLAPAPESPEQKRAAELENKIKFENIKEENKARSIESKELKSVEKDLPALEKSLKGVKELKRIAEQNPDMFGHGFMPDRYARTTKLKDFGKWQNLISDAIAGLEQKLSSRGNIVALKMAAQLKPSHAEQQSVALGKLDSMEEQLNEAIKNSYKKLNKENPFESPNTKSSLDLSKMSDEELIKIAYGGQ